MKKFLFLLIISCGAPSTVENTRDPVIPNESCHTKAVEEGVLITCPNQAPALVRHGQKGEKGSSCFATPKEQGVEIFCDNEIVTLSNGRTGATGKSGQDGKDGIDGQDGKQGKAGQDGQDGKDGVNGKDGAINSCSATSVTEGVEVSCTDGTKSLIKHGAQGIQGLPGVNGTSCSVFEIPEGAKIFCSDGTNAVAKNGEKGDNGEQGETGLPGEAGASMAVVKLCPNDRSSFPEYGMKLGSSVYAVYYGNVRNGEPSNNGILQAFFTKLLPGRYVSTNGTNCQFTLTANGDIIQ